MPNLMLLQGRKQDGTEAFETVLKKFYVYDCGSESPDAFDRALRTHNLKSGTCTDILFISHLDSDHVNKIDRLMGAAPAKLVVLPYLDSEDLAALLARELDAGSVTASIREYAADPLKWWLRRGASTVIFVEPGNGDDESPEGGTPDRPIDPDRLVPSSLEASEGAQARLACFFRKPRGHAPKGFEKPNYNVPQDIDHDLPQGGILAGCGSYFRLEWRTSSREGWRLGDWILLPYVHPVESAVRIAFRSAVLAEFGLAAPDHVEFASALLDAVRTKRKKLVSLYADHFEVSQNAISMSLYSGPASLNVGEVGFEWMKAIGPAAIGYEMVPSPVGWLGTGDSKLKQTARRKPWLKFFKSFSSNVLILSLPHHGSFNDFDEEILDFDALVVAVATTILKRNRISGLRDTLERVESAGKSYKVVDDKAKNTLTVACARSMRAV